MYKKFLSTVCHINLVFSGSNKCRNAFLSIILQINLLFSGSFAFRNAVLSKICHISLILVEALHVEIDFCITHN